MSTKTKKGVVAVVTAILILIAAGTLLIGIPNGWYDIEKTTLSSEYFGQSEKIILDQSTYEKLVSEKKSFIILTHQPGCAANILTYLKDFAAEKNFSYYYFLWSDLRETSIKSIVNFPPSVIIIRDGRVIKHLDANSNDDVEYYNSYDSFKKWLEEAVNFE